MGDIQFFGVGVNLTILWLIIRKILGTSVYKYHTTMFYVILTQVSSEYRLSEWNKNKTYLWVMRFRIQCKSPLSFIKITPERNVYKKWTSKWKFLQVMYTSDQPQEWSETMSNSSLTVHLPNTDQNDIWRFWVVLGQNMKIEFS